MKFKYGAVCEECGSRSCSRTSENAWQCRDCGHVFRKSFGLSFSQEIFTGYNIFDDYDNYMRHHYFTRFLDLERTDSFLDAGCGWGCFTLYASFQVANAVGLDLEKWILHMAEQMKNQMNLADVTFQHGSIYNIPYPDMSFDKVLCAEVLEHLTDPKFAVKELTRVCRSTLVIQAPTVTPLKRIGNRILSLLLSTDYRVTDEDEQTSLPHIQLFTGQSLKNMIEQLHFRVTDVVAVRILPLNLIMDNKLFLHLQWFCDRTAGTTSPFNTMGTMTIIKATRTN